MTVESAPPSGARGKRPRDVARLRVAELFLLDPESELLLQALTHKSYAHEVSGARDNQRLEFLGDSVLGFLVSDALSRRFPTAQEGKLTRTRAQVVSTEALADFAQKNSIFEAIRFGKGAAEGSGTQSSKVLADAVEALIAASYLERGIDTARQICERLVEAALAGAETGARDPKSELQERVQAVGLGAPTYRVVERRGPAHETEFLVEVVVAGQALGQGKGRSRRAAEVEAAITALREEAYVALAQSAAAQPAEAQPAAVQAAAVQAAGVELSEPSLGEP